PSTPHFVLPCSRLLRDPPPSPTRRSSDLWDNPVPPNDPAHLAAHPAHDPEQARHLLKKAGYERLAVDLYTSASRSYPAFFSRWRDRKSTRLNSSHRTISYAVFCLKKTINK